MTIIKLVQNITFLWEAFMAIIAISRQVAALGDEISEAVAQKLGYKFINRKMIEKRIVEMGFPESKLEKYDERKPGFFASLARDRDEYLDYLQTAVLEAAADGNCVLIGRGSFVILDRVPNLLSFKFVAETPVRVKRLMDEFLWDEKKALQRINESDNNRRGFHKSFFNLESDDLSHFHMIINTGLISVDSASDVIVQTVKDCITPEKENEGNAKVKEMLLSQRIVNSLVFTHKLNINFLHAEIIGKKMMLHGVADSAVVAEKALVLASKELPDYKIESSISIVQDFKAYS